VGVVGERGEDPLRALVTEEIDGGVHGDPVQPGIEPSFEVEPLQRPPQAKEDGLGHVPGVFEVPDDLVSRPDDPLALPEDQVLEGAPVAARGGAYQIVEVLVVPHPQSVEQDASNPILIRSPRAVRLVRRNPDGGAGV